MKIKYQLDFGGYKPTKAHKNDAGFDLYVPEDYSGEGLVDTKVHVLIPDGYVGIIYPRSSMTKRGFITHAGVIDSGYTGTIKLKLDYIGDNSGIHYHAGERVAQLIIIKLPDIELEIGDVTGTKTDRGNNGFGSSGK